MKKRLLVLLGVLAAVAVLASLGVIVETERETTSRTTSLNGVGVGVRPGGVQLAGRREADGTAPGDSAANGMGDSASRATVRRASSAGSTIELASDRRTLLAANERVEIELDPASFDTTSPVILRADNGGLLDDQPLRPQMTLAPSDGPRRFAFRAGGYPGRYTVEVRQGSSFETLEFWVGPPKPLGRAGPARQISLPSNLVAHPG
jgi:hypothetical protein